MVGEAARLLFSLAQTCRVFSEPSLDSLWRRLHLLEPLIRCYATILDEETEKVLLVRLFGALGWQLGKRCHIATFVIFDVSESTTLALDD